MLEEILDRVDTITMLNKQFLMGEFGIYNDQVEDEAYEILNSILHLGTMLQNAKQYTPQTVPRTLVHDLYNPLAVVIGYAELIINEGNLEKHQRDVMATIQDNARVVYDLIGIVFRKKEYST